MMKIKESGHNVQIQKMKYIYGHMHDGTYFGT
jgi:hypothetical protein